MALTIDQLSGGLTPEHDLFFAERPADPDMRESTSVWISDDAGRISFPRFGIEAEAHDWDNPLCTGNVCWPDGRVLCAIRKGVKPPVLGANGQPTVLGAGPLRFECLELFRRWKVTYEGTIADGTVQQTLKNSYDLTNQIPFRFEFDLELVTPAWVFDKSPEKLKHMSDADRQEAEYMGVGWRIEQHFRGQGRYLLDGQWHDFTGSGLRIKRQSVRPLGGFRGHAWQSAIFPDGRAFGYIAYPPREADGRAYNEAYVYVDGQMHMGRASVIPWLRHLAPSGADVALEIETDLGTTRIGGTTVSSYFYRSHPGVADLDLQQASVRYNWDGQDAYGMMERSSSPELTSED